MKKIITVLIIILFCFITTINAQTLVDTNKVWTVVDCLNFGACETSIYKFQGDTIISGINYKKYPVLLNIYERQILKIKKAISTLHTDLQCDYEKELEEIIG